MLQDSKDYIETLSLSFLFVCFFKDGSSVIFLLFVPHRVMMVAKKFLDAGHKLNFAVASRKTFSHELSDFGLESTTGEVPVVAIRTAKGEKFVMQEEFS